jgi:hypothetical protein
LKVRNEVDTVLETAHQEGWEDYEIFGYGEMITEPQEAKGWKLIPANLYEYSIPTEGIARLHQIINAGVRIRGVIIADDELNRETPPAPANPIVSLPKIESITIFLGRVMRALLLLTVAGAVLSLLALSLIYLAPILILGFIVTAGASTDYDPKLVILVDDGNGGTVWVSIFTWYE